MRDRHTHEEADAKWLIKKGLTLEPYLYEIPESGERFEYVVVENDLSQKVGDKMEYAEVVPSPQVMPLAGPSRTAPVVTSSFMSYAILALLLIVVIWFVVRKWWNSWKKSNTKYSPNQNYFLSSPGISDVGLYDRRPEVRR